LRHRLHKVVLDILHRVDLVDGIARSEL
jgi:hypothetical protein